MKYAASAAIDMLDPDECRSFLVRHFHPGGASCPHCKISLEGRQAESFAAGGRICCNACRRWSTWRTGTVFHRTPLGDRQIYLLLMLTGLHSAIEDISIACQLSAEEAFCWQRRICEAYS